MIMMLIMIVNNDCIMIKLVPIISVRIGIIASFTHYQVPGRAVVMS